MFLGAPGTVSMSSSEIAGCTPYQHGGGSTPCSIALSDTEPPIEPATHSTTGAPAVFSAHSTSARVSSVEAGLPHDFRWNDGARDRVAVAVQRGEERVVGVGVDVAALAVEPDHDALGLVAGREGQPDRLPVELAAHDRARLLTAGARGQREHDHREDRDQGDPHAKRPLGS